MTTWRRFWATLVILGSLPLVAIYAADQLKGEGYVLNDDENVVTYKVEDTKDAKNKDKTIFVLKMKNGMWWKSIVLKRFIKGHEIHVFEIRTGVNKQLASIGVQPADMRGDVTIILGKGESFAWWKEVARTTVDGDSLIGKTITFDWLKDYGGPRFPVL
jgi:hypothetical protein